jgi:hypothetical protein
MNAFMARAAAERLDRVHPDSPLARAAAEWPDVSEAEEDDERDQPYVTPLEAGQVGDADGGMAANARTRADHWNDQGVFSVEDMARLAAAKVRAVAIFLMADDDAKLAAYAVELEKGDRGGGTSCGRCWICRTPALCHRSEDPRRHGRDGSRKDGALMDYNYTVLDLCGPKRYRASGRAPRTAALRAGLIIAGLFAGATLYLFAFGAL